MATAFLFKMISVAFYTLGAMTILPIFCVESYVYWKYASKKEGLFNTLALLVYILYLLQIAGALSSMLVFNNAFGCRYVSSAIIAIHFICRGAYFSIFIVRIHLVFDAAPMFNYSKKLIYTLFITVICFAIMLSFIYIYNHLLNSYFDVNAQRCMSPIPIYLLALTAVYDLTFNLLTLYLFISKLREIVHMGSDIEHTEDRDKLNAVILKCTVLVLVTVLTSFVLAGIYGPLLGMGLDIIATDWIVNVICIAMMKKHYHAFYDKLCFYPTKCVRYCCIHKNARDLPNLIALQTGSSQQSTNAVTSTHGSDLTEKNNSQPIRPSSERHEQSSTVQSPTIKLEVSR